jgi:uncharacterized membrane protein YkvA (DUF1232 family)
MRRLREWAERAKTEALALYFAARDARTPWYARALVVLIVAYLASPIDLIPDFLPLVGLLDDAILIPLGVWLALRMIPAEVMASARERAQALLAGGLPHGRAAAAVIIALWVGSAILVGWFAYRAYR